ncbi:MAG TPA: hypothetical protein VHV51_01745 [Polyangiaceae bacterium]|nr:hypothetical protein [Polyangiaceae bacterium]
MSLKGDARVEVSSSDSARFSPGLTLGGRFAALGFAGFVLLHVSCEAWRARFESVPPAAHVETAPISAVLALVLIWLPFLLFAAAEFRRARPSEPKLSGDREHALGVLERVALAVVCAFAFWHTAELTWPLVSGNIAAEDVRPELIALLSSTRFGVPLTAAGYVCGVGAASFVGTRLALRLLARRKSRAFSRALVALGVLAYLLGSYAVIRDASGVILPP